MVPNCAKHHQLRVKFTIKEYLTDYSGAIVVNFEHAFVCLLTLLNEAYYEILKEVFHSYYVLFSGLNYQ